MKIELEVICWATQDVTVTHFSPSTLEKETLFNAGKKNNNPFLSGLNTSLPEHGATPGATLEPPWAALGHPGGYHGAIPLGGATLAAIPG